ncbi:hypothetical protein [Bacillus marasmi]|uniref:hypothetical protein n=1 Tax=Bacillus marasmi TaxID=1926279 RepID=UPI0011C865A3|nr:hypothetical protein [Bacillus marasmi]
MSIELALIPIAIAVGQTIATRLDSKIEKKPSRTYKTIMKEERLLARALKAYGCSVTNLDNQVSSSIGDIGIIFQKDEEGVIRAIFSNEIGEEHALQFLDNISTEYRRLVQEDTYQKLLQRAKDKGYILESEEINEQNSIVLTFQINQEQR